MVLSWTVESYASWTLWRCIYIFCLQSFCTEYLSFLPYHSLSLSINPHLHCQVLLGDLGQVNWASPFLFCTSCWQHRPHSTPGGGNQLTGKESTDTLRNVSLSYHNLWAVTPSAGSNELSPGDWAESTALGYRTQRTLQRDSSSFIFALY